MGDALVKCVLHIVFSTKNRAELLSENIQRELYPYFGGVCRNKGLLFMAADGTKDHVHLLLALPATVTIADAVRDLKANSSRWVHEHFSSEFKWQVGYGAFSVSSSRIKETIDYIHNQKEHHRKVTFQEEYVNFLRLYNIEYNEKYLWE